MHKKHAKSRLVIESRGTCLEIVNRDVHASGYIYVQKDKKKVSYHRIVWEQAHGPLGPKQVVRQLCGNRRCCNLKHLSLGLHSQDIEYTVADNGCHVCTSHKPCQYGYPQGRDRVNSTGVTEYLHRIVWKRTHGPIPAGLLVRHKCDNRMCVNPAHLELGSQADNSRDMVERGRAAKGGAGHARAILTIEQVREIRALLAQGVHQKDIAAKYGTPQPNVSAIKRGKTWRHVQ